jgi:hypothetical protein
MLIQPLIPKQVIRWMLDMTKLIFYSEQMCSFHQSNAVYYVNIGRITEVYIQYTTFGFRPHVFLFHDMKLSIHFAI